MTTAPDNRASRRKAARLRRQGVAVALGLAAALVGGVVGLRLGARPNAAAPPPEIAKAIQIPPTAAPSPTAPGPAANETDGFQDQQPLPMFEETIETAPVLDDDTFPAAPPDAAVTAAIDKATAAIRPPTPSEAAAPPAWRRFAVAVPPSALDGRPMIAMVVDDLGPPHARTERVIDLPGPLTLAFLPYADHLRADTARARRNGHELLVHMPLEPLSPDQYPGPEAIVTGLREDELRARLDHNLSRFDGYVGINNHMGSKLSEDAASMAIMLAELRDRGLLYLDSVTVAGSLGLPIARALGVPATRRNVFIDNDLNVDAIKAQLAVVERLARKRGYAVAIGHPHEATIAALADWLPGLAARGFALVPISAIVAREEGVKVAVRETGGERDSPTLAATPPESASQPAPLSSSQPPPAREGAR